MCRSNFIFKFNKIFKLKIEFDVTLPSIPAKPDISSKQLTCRRAASSGFKILKRKTYKLRTSDYEILILKFKI